MYQHFAEREAALFAQVLLPFLRQRNPVAHARFESDLADLDPTEPCIAWRAPLPGRARVAHGVTTSSPGAPRILIDRAGLDERVRRLAAEIGADHPDGVVLVGVLKGALLFLSDLARALSDQGVPVVVDFLAISRYAPDTGRVRILEDLAVDVEGRDVILVEDLVDTGLTLAYLHRARA